ncbi:MAG TPA: PASTA domain-containing protein [Terriglobales bacterium]|nr:PASTA domain-containing protein [Terriglobales bacterium]
MKVIAKLVLLVLVLVIVAMVSALTAMQFAIHTREVPVPNLVGKTVAEAQRSALGSGLEVQVERQYYSADVPEGRIMSQVPDPGTKVRRGWQLRVAQSLGPQRVAIPDLSGETSRAAELNIERRGLELGATALLATSSVPPDQVIAQSPPANASGVAAPRISVLLSTPAPAEAYVMPNLVGQSLGAATQILQAAGMHLGTVKVSATPAAPNTQEGQSPAPAPDEIPSVSSLILSQQPTAGQKIIAGSAVNFEVSR